MHGKVSPVTHDNTGLFAGAPNPMDAGRYHSLVGQRATLPDCLHITAETADGEIMRLRHATHPTHGVQFHPESVLTPHGHIIMRNFLDML
jgi:anthranilate synthase component 2